MSRLSVPEAANPGSDVDTRHLEAAVAVARHGSFTTAARELFMAQSTVTRQVAALERELGRMLFVRHGRNVELTRAGVSYIAEAQEVLQALARAAVAIRGADTAVPASRAQNPQ